MKQLGITTLSISKPTKKRLVELVNLNEQRFVDWDIALNDLIDFVVEKTGLELQNPNPTK